MKEKNKIENYKLSDEELKNINGGDLYTAGLWKVKCITAGCGFRLDTPVSFDDAEKIAHDHAKANRKPDGTAHEVAAYQDNIIIPTTS